MAERSGIRALALSRKGARPSHRRASARKLERGSLENAIPTGDRGFESIPLQRGVCREPAPERSGSARPQIPNSSVLGQHLLARGDLPSVGRLFRPRSPSSALLSCFSSVSNEKDLTDGRPDHPPEEEGAGAPSQAPFGGNASRNLRRLKLGQRPMIRATVRRLPSGSAASGTPIPM
jgi:hypothetical protein